MWRERAQNTNFSHNDYFKEWNNIVVENTADCQSNNKLI